MRIRRARSFSFSDVGCTSTIRFPYVLPDADHRRGRQHVEHQLRRARGLQPGRPGDDFRADTQRDGQVHERLEVGAGVARDEDDARAGVPRDGEAPADERRGPARRHPHEDVALRRPHSGDRSRAFIVAVFGSLPLLERRCLAAGQNPLHQRGGVPNVFGISAASSTPSRPLVPAPMNTSRPPLRSAWVIMSTARAMRSRSRPTAASIFRSSASITSMISADASLSKLRLAGLMASVGNCCHLDWRDMAGHPGFAKARRQILAPGHTPVKPPSGAAGDAPDGATAGCWTSTSITSGSNGASPRTRWRATPGTSGGSRRSPAGRDVAIGALTRPQLEAFVRSLIPTAWPRGRLRVPWRARGACTGSSCARDASRPARPRIFARRAHGRRCRGTCRRMRSTG